MPSRRKRKRASNRPADSQPALRPPAAREPLPRWKKLLFAAVTISALLAALEVVLAIAGVEPVLVREDPYVGFTSRIPLFVRSPRTDGRPEMVTAKNKLRYFNPQRFAEEKPAGSFRIFCLGGSTTFGRPYDDMTSFCGWLRELLPAADPSRKWELINAGGISYASYRVAMLIEELIRYEPDLFVIYSGQNEFLERRTYGRIIDTPRAVRRLGALASRTRTYAAIDAAARALGKRSAGTQGKRQELSGEVETLLDHTVGPEAYHRDDQLQERVLAHYRHNLARMIDVARSVGAKVVLVTPASNLQHCSPFKSEHREGLGDAQLGRWQAAFDRAEEAYAAAQWEQALVALDEAVSLDDAYAHLHYLRGRVLLELQRFEEAKDALERARDEDVCPLRALGPMPAIVAAVAADRGVPVVDFAALAESRSDHGIPGKSMFLDHVHPTIEGQRLLALEILNELVRQGIAEPSSRWGNAAIEQVAARIYGRLDRRAHGIALRNLSKVLGWAGKLEEAGELAREATRLAPDDAEACFEAALGASAAGDVERAISFYRRAIRLDSAYARAHSNLGSLKAERGEISSATEHFRKAIAIDPDDQNARFNLGRLLLKQGRAPQAMEHFRHLIELDPGDAETHTQLAAALLQTGRIDQATEHVRKAIEARPGQADLQNKLGILQAAVGEYRTAEQSYRRALELDAGHAGAAANLAWLLATARDREVRDGAEAVRLASRLCRGNDFQDPVTLDALSAAQAEVGRFDQAVQTAQKALRLAESDGQSGLAGELRERIDLFRDRRPYRPGSTRR